MAGSNGAGELDRYLVGDDGMLPSARYTDRDFLRLELDKVWSQVWQIACREEEIAAPGDYVEYTIGDQSILVVRTADSSLRGFFNACLHRGTRLARDCGSFEGGEIRCRYHAWRYDLEGRLVDVVDRHEFQPFPEGLALAGVAVDTWGGFVWVTMNPSPPPLIEYLHPIADLLAPYHLESMRLRGYQSTVLPANWKVVVDAFNEAYHVQGTHPQLLPWTDDVSIQYEPLGIHSHYGRLKEARRLLRPSPRLGLRDDEYDEGEILSGLVSGLGRLFLAEEMAIVDELRASDDQTDLLGRFQERRMMLLHERGLDVSGFTAEQMTSADDVFIFPNVVGPLYPGSAIVFRVRPNGLDPDSAVKDIWTLEWPRAGNPSARVEKRFYPDWSAKDWGIISNQDYANMEEVQTGMKARSCIALRLNPRQESNVLHMHRMLDQYLLA